MLNLFLIFLIKHAYHYYIVKFVFNFPPYFSHLFFPPFFSFEIIIGVLHVRVHAKASVLSSSREREGALESMPEVRFRVTQAIT